MNKTSRKASRKFTRNRKKMDLNVRFWRQVNKTESCWLWTGPGSGPKGAYGGITINKKSLKAHRVSWELENGPIPDGLCVLHKCDNPKCVNPEHLFLGTKKDNTQDMIQKGRHYTKTKPQFILRGSDANPAKLNEKQVFQLRRLRLKGVSYHRMAKWINMSRQTIRKAVNGSQWVHVPMPLHIHDTLESHKNPLNS